MIGYDFEVTGVIAIYGVSLVDDPGGPGKSPGVTC
jgi:hypothetical protein